jgi:NADPH:quinone reductase-like Zn-dependent oxidoreductase
VIDYRNEDFARPITDIDVVLDTIGGDVQARSYDVLRAGGFLASTVAPPDEAFAKAHNVDAAFVFHSSDAGRLANIVESVAGGVEVLTDRVVPITEAAQAFEYQASERARGKIILTLR